MSELLTELFSSRMRAAVLAHIVPRSHIGHSLTELHRALGLSISSLQHECYKLERIGVLVSQREGTSRRYRLNPESEIRYELSALVATGMGQDEALRATLELVPGLRVAFLAALSPIQRDSTRENWKIPLVLIGEVPLEELEAAHERVAALLGVPLERIEMVFYLPADWQMRLDQQSAYALALLSGTRVDLIGDPADVFGG